MEKQLTDLLNKYRTESAAAGPDENIELEIRFKDITREVFEQLYQALSSSSTARLECSINIISENVFEKTGEIENRYIRKLIFVKGIKAEESYIVKSRLARAVHVNDYINYVVTLAREKKSKVQFSANVNAVVRFKLRVSFDLIDSPLVGQEDEVVHGTGLKWRIDMTAIKQGVLSELGPQLQVIKDELFKPGLSVDNFLKEINFDLITGYEVEIEHVGADKNLTVDDLAIVKKVYSLVNPKYLEELAYREELDKVARIALPSVPKGRVGLKMLSNPPVSLTKNLYYTELYPPTGYYLTEKADGVTCLVSVQGRRCRLLTSAELIEFEIESGADELTIALGELVEHDLYLFDVLMVRDENIANEGFSKRLTYLESAANVINEYKGYTARPKKFTRLEEPFKDKFEGVYSAKYPYEIDGLILTEPGAPYHATKNYKWKPRDRQTIDFLAVKCPSKMLGIAPYLVKPGRDLYLLFVGINHNMREKLGLGFLPNYKHFFPDERGAYYPIQFSPSVDPHAYLYYHKPELGSIDRKIVELKCASADAGPCTEWEFIRVRDDRQLERGYYGNDFRIAEMTYMNLVDPFNLEDLWNPQVGYFAKTAKGIHAAPNKYKRFVISLLLRDLLSDAKWVIDEAAGRGADLHRYQEIGVKNALFIDVDSTAIAELIRRKFEYFGMKKRRGGGVWFGGDDDDESAARKALAVHTLVANLKTDANELIAAVDQFGLRPGMTDGVVCNFALHYMCDSIDNLRNVLKFNATMLKLGGVFMFTVMDGKKVFELLKNLKPGDTWQVRQDEHLKYAITKKYSSERLAPAGQMISILLPFADEMYDEPLCNIETVAAEAKKLGLELEMNESFSTYMGKFEKVNKELYERLTPDDKAYIDLFHYVSMRKVKEPKIGGRR